MKSANRRGVVLTLGGLLIVTLAAGCAAGPMGWNYPYNTGYQPYYAYTGGYQNPPYYNQYPQNQQNYCQRYLKNLQTYNQQHPYNQQSPQYPCNQQYPYYQQHKHH